MVNNMEGGCIGPQQARKRKENGMKANVQNG
jgi:hypothetical protein